MTKSTAVSTMQGSSLIQRRYSDALRCWARLQKIHRADDCTKDILVADRETHTRQRRLLSHAFSEKSLREQESILAMYVTKLLEELSARCTSGPLNMVAWYTVTSKPS